MAQLVKGFINKDGEQVEIIPASHNHIINNITGLNTKLTSIDAKILTLNTTLINHDPVVYIEIDQGSDKPNLEDIIDAIYEIIPSQEHSYKKIALIVANTSVSQDIEIQHLLPSENASYLDNTGNRVVQHGEIFIFNIYDLTKIIAISKQTTVFPTYAVECVGKLK